MNGFSYSLLFTIYLALTTMRYSVSADNSSKLTLIGICWLSNSDRRTSRPVFAFINCTIISSLPGKATSLEADSVSIYTSNSAVLEVTFEFSPQRKVGNSIASFSSVESPPSMTESPLKPSFPSSPAEPAFPARPAIPAEPAAPEAPFAPDAPAIPGVPGAPGIPGMPTPPSVPSVP